MSMKKHLQNIKRRAKKTFYEKGKQLFFIIFLIGVSSIFAFSQNIKKTNLKVLYVGGSADYSNQHYKTPEEKAEGVKHRMTSFETMLRTYFTDVTVINGADYKSEMSWQYDATVIDAILGLALTAQNSPFSMDFDYPVLFIGETGSALNRAIGLKFDWYCLCLGGNALQTKMEHAIFKGPFPVKITQTNRPVPEVATYVDYLDKLPAAIPMWTVQRRSYDNTKELRSGMVSSFGGFEDSPEAEVISGGNSIKEINAVAIARHGNFFHWGYSASPEDLTPEAQTVLANAIVYISKFRNKGVIARKFDDRVVTRYYVGEMRDMMTMNGYKKITGYFKAIQVTANRRIDSLRHMKETGGKLTPQEEQMLVNFKVPPEQTLPEFIKQYQKDLYPKLGDNLQAYQDYFTTNMPYFWSDGVGKLIVDDDAKKLRISNSNPQLLETAIKLWESNKDVDMAKRILTRYTLLDYRTPKEWRNWFDKNRSKIFFTESGGYYFLINSYDKSVEGNKYPNKKI